MLIIRLVEYDSIEAYKIKR